VIKKYFEKTNFWQKNCQEKNAEISTFFLMASFAEWLLDIL